MIVPLAILSIAASTAPAGPPDLIEILDRLDRETVPTQASVERILGRALKCSAAVCEADGVALRAGRIGSIEFQPGAVRLYGVSGTCLRVTEIMQRYTGGTVVNGCTDGAICMYYKAKRSWGTLWVSLPPNGSTSGCMTGAAFNYGS